jgi:tRNA pseudouridine55 synthase
MSHSTQHNTSEGEVLLIDKPLGWTSFDVVKRIRWSFDVAKVGHAGTLDPMASGLLIVCTNARTKTIDTFVNLDKEYTGSFQLGIQTPSFDSETNVTAHCEYSHITHEMVVAATKEFIGIQRQTPPMYSAVKHKGKPLYHYARKGKVVTRAPKMIEIREFMIDQFNLPEVTFRVVCSKGTYIRALVNDVGQRLGCGAVLTSLQRTRIGQYHLSDALTIEELENRRLPRKEGRRSSHGQSISA